MKKYFILLLVSILCLCGCTKTEKLPAPKEAGELQVDENINVETIDNYLNIENAVYRDMRMLIDDAEYENIGGDSFLSGFVKGFEVIPYPYLIKVEGLPEAVGEPYSGPTLFSIDEDGKYVANYEESMDILEYYFPKDKTIFLMCGGGGYAGMTKTLLVALGWDANKIYNTGGYWSYKGENKVEVKRVDGDETIYDFWKVTYHDIDFAGLHEVK